VIALKRNDTKWGANLVYSLESFAKCSLPKARARELRAPLKIRIAKDELDRWSILYGATGSDNSA